MDNTAMHLPTDTHINIPQLRQAYLDALHIGSGRTADRVVRDVLDAGVTANAIYLDLFQPTAYHIGELWQRNVFSVAQEHLATAIIERQMVDLHAHFKPRREQGRTVVIGCVEHEMHHMGSRMVADFFEQDGWTVHYLGGDVPPSALIAIAREMKADLIGLKAQLVTYLPAVTAFVQQLARHGLDGIPVMVGGLPFVEQPDLYKVMGVQFCGIDAAEAVRQANALFPSGMK